MTGGERAEGRETLDNGFGELVAREVLHKTSGIAVRNRVLDEEDIVD